MGVVKTVFAMVNPPESERNCISSRGGGKVGCGPVQQYGICRTILVSIQRVAPPEARCAIMHTTVPRPIMLKILDSFYY